MGNQLTRPLMASELAAALGLPFRGNDHVFDRILPLNAAVNSALSFSSAGFPEPRIDTCVVIAPPGTPVTAGTVIDAENPRLVFAKALNLLKAEPGFVLPQVPAQVHREAWVSPMAVIGKGARIGKGSVVHHFVVIGDDVQIGDNCTIKSGAVIGEEGFGFERDFDGTPVRLPHLGSVIIGNRVEVGSLATVCRGTLADTIVEDDAKIDDHVHIGHNCKIRRGAMLSAGAVLGGGVDVGEYSWVGLNATVIQRMTVGAGALIGIGANAMRPVAPGDTLIGYPARSAIPGSSGGGLVKRS
jgi:acyl-[acyl carrier protein]--UDP-N-acetylglucosamine O-acyltransferase